MNNYKPLIDRLADKTTHEFISESNSMLSADCDKCMKKDTWGSSEKDPAWIREPCIPDPILLGDVLEKLKKLPDNSYFINRDELVSLWSNCNASRSLQNIAEDVEEVCMDCPIGGDCECMMEKDRESANLQKQLKPNSKALLSFLEEIF